MKIIYSGRVQGVGFRYYTSQLASIYKIYGSVKNLKNGEVELIINDNCKNIEAFLKKIESGNGFMRITGIKRQNFECKDENFMIKY